MINYETGSPMLDYMTMTLKTLQQSGQKRSNLIYFCLRPKPSKSKQIKIYLLYDVFCLRCSYLKAYDFSDISNWRSKNCFFFTHWSCFFFCIFCFGRHCSWASPGSTDYMKLFKLYPKLMELKGWTESTFSNCFVWKIQVEMYRKSG